MNGESDNGRATPGPGNPHRAEALLQARGAGGRPDGQFAGRRLVGGLVKVHTLPGK